MDTDNRLHENISALADGELAASEQELAFAALKTPDGMAAWQAYHLIGDTLRDGARGTLSEGFSAALAARLGREAAHEVMPYAAHGADPGSASASALVPAPATSPSSSSSSASAVGAGNAAAANVSTAPAADSAAQGHSQSRADVIFP